MEVNEWYLNYFGDERDHNLDLWVRQEEYAEYYLFPREVIERTIKLLQESSVRYAAIPADSEEIGKLGLRESRYSVEEYDESEVLAVNSIIPLGELYELIDYVKEHEDLGDARIRLYANSERPEFQELLSGEHCANLTPELKEALSGYMKMLLDLPSMERYVKIINFPKDAKFGKLLNYYNTAVQEFIVAHVDDRVGIKLLKEMDEESR